MTSWTALICAWIFPWVSGTALGRAVVPEVYISNAKSAGPAGGVALRNSGGIAVLAQSSKQPQPDNSVADSKGCKRTAGMFRRILAHASRNLLSESRETNASLASESDKKVASVLTVAAGSSGVATDPWYKIPR